jgi:hypothetical protein
MRKIVLVFACAAVLAGCERNIKNTVQLSPQDPKFNSPECVSVRDKHYNDGSLEEQAGSFILGAAVPGGGMAATAAEYRKREMVDHEVELACMSNPPNRPLLDPAATIGR